MKLNTDRPIFKFTAIMLSAVLLVACGSDSESPSDADTVMLSEASSGEDCTKYYPGVTVNFGPTEASNALINEIGGICTLSNTVLSSAASNQRLFVKNNYCSLAEGTADAIGQGDMSLALTKLHGLAEEGQFDADEFDTLKRALSLCGYETVLNVAVEEFLKSSELNIYSIGSVSYGDSRCPAILWSLSNEQYGQSYGIEGLGNCSGAELPNQEYFNTNINPEAPLRGDYISEVLKYDGQLPADINEKDGSYTIISNKYKIRQTNETVTPPRLKTPDSSLDQDLEKYIHWSSGDENVDNEYLKANQALSIHYHADGTKAMPPRERALTALQFSYGAPLVSEVEQVVLGLQPGVHATVTTGSGDRFIIVVNPVGDMSIPDLIAWLSDSRLDLLVMQNRDPEKGENLTLHGASFTDGTRTVYGRLLSCQCSAQGILGWLGQDKLEIVQTQERVRKDFIARTRDTVTSIDWTMTSEFGPRAISYVRSSYDDSAFNNDAAFVLHEKGLVQTLYVAMDLTCNEESLLFDFGDTVFRANAECINLANGGVSYSLVNDSDEQMSSIQSGSRMTVGLVASGAETSHEQFQFSLRGATSSINDLVADEQSVDDQVLQFFGGSSLSSETERRLFELLQQRPVFCRDENNPPQCVPTEEPTQVADAEPAMRAAKPAMPVAQPEEFVFGYTKVFAEQIASSGKPVCTAVADSMLSMARSERSSAEREQQIDLIISRAPNICF